MKKITIIFVFVLTLITIVSCADKGIDNEPLVVQQDEQENTHEIEQTITKEEVPALQENIPTISHENNTENSVVQQANAMPVFIPQLTSFKTADMPQPFNETVGDVGGDLYKILFSSLMFDNKKTGGLDMIPYNEFFVDVNEFYAWVESPEMNRYWNEPVTNPMSYPNFYSFVITFNIPVDRLREYMEQNEKRRMEVGLNTKYTQEEIEIILSLNESRILEYFISDYSIFHNGRGFTPSWIYWHDTEAYRAVGITPEMLEEKLHLYAEFNFTPEATRAFEEKLTEFVGRDVVLEREAQGRGN